VLLQYLNCAKKIDSYHYIGAVWEQAEKVRDLVNRRFVMGDAFKHILLSQDTKESREHLHRTVFIQEKDEEVICFFKWFRLDPLIYVGELYRKYVQRQFELDFVFHSKSTLM